MPICSYPGCETLVLGTLCENHMTKSAGTRYPHLYGRRWRKLRRVFLAEHPFCVMCEEENRVRPAEEVDHIKQHDGDPELFYDLENLQGLCKFHHRTIKAEMERSGKVRGCRADGTPLDPENPWHEPKKNKIRGAI